jgi:hypothetical protein
MRYVALTLMLHVGKYMSLMFYLLFKVLTFLLARSQNCEKRLLASSCVCVCLSVHPSFFLSVPNGRIFMKFNIKAFFETVEEIKVFFFKSDKNS